MVVSKVVKTLFLFVFLAPPTMFGHGPGCSCGCSSKPVATKQPAKHGSGCSCSSCSTTPAVKTGSRSFGDRSMSQPKPKEKTQKLVGRTKKKKKKGWFSWLFPTTEEDPAGQAAAQEEKSKKISKMEYAELKKEKERLIAKGDKYLAIKYLEKMVPLCSDLFERSGLLLELADLMFETSHMAKAERLYSEFVSLFPGDKRTEYASYRAITCCFEQSSEYYRDQSKTQETVQLAQTHLSRKEVFTTYTQDVVDILQQCHKKLLESEMNIFNFYLKQGRTLAAKTRLKNIESEYVPLLPDQEPVILAAGCDLAEHMQDTVLLAEKKAELAARFPDFGKEEILAKSDKKSKQTSFVDKF